MSEKRYYWLKLNEDFFDDDTVTYLEEQENGHEYVIFYLKLCLKSLKDEGSLIRYVGNTLMPYDSKALAKLTNTSIDTVNVCMKAFHEIGLIEVKETGEIYMSQINEMIGSETDNAKRVRKHRLMKNRQKALQSNREMLQCNIDVTKCNTEIEKEIEKEIEIETKKDNIDFNEIMIKWNAIPELANIKVLNDSRKKKIRTRIKETSLEELYKVIEKVASSKFLLGKTGGSWKANFDWILKPDKYLAVLEGNYDDNASNRYSTTGKDFLSQAKEKEDLYADWDFSDKSDEQIEFIELEE